MCTSARTVFVLPGISIGILSTSFQGKRKGVHSRYIPNDAIAVIAIWFCGVYYNIIIILVSSSDNQALVEFCETRMVERHHTVTGQKLKGLCNL
jgi:hypothetical protein